MDEHIDKVKPGDPVSARRANEISEVCERFGQAAAGSYVGMHHGASTFSIIGKPPFQQYVFLITSLLVDDDDVFDSGLYKGKIRWYSAKDEEWKTDDSLEPQLDARDTNLLFYKNDRVVCYWDAQRGRFVPIFSHHLPLVDLNGSLSGMVSSTEYGGSDIRFALEISHTGSSGWAKANGRDWVVNGNVTPNSSGEAHASGCGIYTFSVTGRAFVRVSVQTDLAYGAVDVYSAVLRLEAKDRKGSGYSTSAALSPSSIVGNWAGEAAINNYVPSDGIGELGRVVPYFALSGTNIQIETPENDEGDRETWTIEVELGLVFSVGDVSSSFGGSSLSSSSLGTSSLLSSSSLGTSSSSSGGSSTSSLSSSSSGSMSESSISTSSQSSSSSTGVVSCDACNAGTTPWQVEVTLALIANLDGQNCCDTFLGYNGTYVLNQTGLSPCIFAYDFPVSPCGDASRLQAQINATGSLDVSLIIDNGVGLLTKSSWSKSKTTPFDCSTIDDDLPLFGSWPFYCNYANSTCHLKAL